ncbi:MAG: NADH-quinone oxidoreductase subunit N [Candidatus Micrarchaeia archaeon]
MEILALVLLSVSLLFIAVGVISAFARSRKFAFISGSVLLAAILLISIILFAGKSNYEILGFLHIYPFSMLFIALFSLAMLLIEFMSYDSKNLPGLQLLMGFALFALVIVPSATSLIIVFIGLELFSVMTSFMILISGSKHVEAAVKFFLLSAISIALFSVSLALMLPFDGSFALASASSSTAVTGSALLLLALVFFIAAMSFDTAMFPFNFWVPDVYEGASANISAMIAGIGKKLAFVVLIEIVIIFFVGSKSTISPILAVLSVFTMFYGNLAAMVQKKMRRLFAYSSISQAGYIMIGVAVATQYGIEASIVQIIAHAFMIIGAFAIIMWLEERNLTTVNDYEGLVSRNRFAAISFTLIMLSMAGIPPLLGFYGKLMLFSSAISANMLILAILGILNSFMSIYYYGKVISAMFMQKEQKPIRLPLNIAIVLFVVLFVVVVLGIYPQLVMQAASTASSSLFGLLQGA